MATRSPLLRLPNEIFQSIAFLLPTDKDVTNLASTCREARQRLLADDSWTWRGLFAAKYDLPPGKTSTEVMYEYLARAIVLPQQINFKPGGREKNKRQKQDLWLQVVQTMLIEALDRSLKGQVSKTYDTIEKVMASVGFLNQPKSRTTSELFYAIQICLTALAFDPAVTTSCLRTDYHIETAYSYDEETVVPVVHSEGLDLASLLDLRSFWQRHLLTRQEATFYESFSRLPSDMKPKMLKTGPSVEKLSGSWLGYYSCIHPIPDTLEGLQHRQTCADLDTHWDQVEILTLEIRSQPDEPFWPDECNRIIPIISQTEESTQEYFSGIQSTYGSTSAENPLFGFTEPISIPYGGLQGWTRICFAICEQASENEPSAWQGASSRWVHGYEAIIIPGGRMMLGRWLDLKEPTGSGRGPFIFWDI